MLVGNLWKDQDRDGASIFALLDFLVTFKTINHGLDFWINFRAGRGNGIVIVSSLVQLMLVGKSASGLLTLSIPI